MNDFKCPHCGYEYDHEGDFEGLDTNNQLAEYCPECDGEFYCYVEFYPTFSRCYKSSDS